MEPKRICQSCSMPIDNPLLAGNEADGRISKEYCAYCYRNGEFIEPRTTIDQMKVIVREQMQKRNIDAATIEQAVNILPKLKRWRRLQVS